jgi:hypothetical protein
MLMIIAQRTLKILTGAQAGSAVLIVVHMPSKDGDGWSCIYEIGWPERPRKSQGAGVDAVQALNIAMQKIGIELYLSSYHAQGSLEFQGTGKGYGFPVPSSMRGMLVGDDR